MTAQELARALATGNFTQNDLSLIRQAYNMAAKRIQVRAANKFYIGDRVWFMSKKGGKVTGIVTKINAKSIHVRTDGGAAWRVSPSLLGRCGE